MSDDLQTAVAIARLEEKVLAVLAVAEGVNETVRETDKKVDDSNLRVTRLEARVEAELRRARESDERSARLLKFDERLQALEAQRAEEPKSDPAQTQLAVAQTAESNERRKLWRVLTGIVTALTGGALTGWLASKK